MDGLGSAVVTPHALSPLPGSLVLQIYISNQCLNSESYCKPLPETGSCSGGANVPALNQLLEPFGVAFGDAVLEGQLTLSGEKLFYASGANIVRFPAGGYLHSAPLGDKAINGGFPILLCRLDRSRGKDQAPL